MSIPMSMKLSHIGINTRMIRMNITGICTTGRTIRSHTIITICMSG
ncbi:MAG: hypothetical protein H7Y05_14645 [Steroidobacteraceae bacterium]|nr:hypothetical protein [Deltaproteobacteria bacterium]